MVASFPIAAYDVNQREDNLALSDKLSLLSSHFR
jgi:hypothetical protein